jgi:hypothetical protein
MKNSLKNSIALVMVLGAALLAAGSAPANAQLSTVSIPSLHLADGERVCGFEIKVKSGRIAALPNVPLGWNVSIDNDPSWRTDIKASIIVGAAALNPDFFRDFLIIEKDESWSGHFEMQGEVIVTRDFEHERRIKVTAKDFVLTSGSQRQKIQQ